MAPDFAVSAGANVERDVMASVDDERFLIADIARDDAWLAMPHDDAPVLGDYR